MMPKSQMVRGLCLLMISSIVSGCVGDNCFRRQGLGVEGSECAEYRATHVRPANPGVEWFEYALFPFVVLAALSDVATGSPHYQAGGSAFRDYTLPSNQPVPQPTYQQQQNNMGNGGGRYGNYPQY